MIRKIVALSLVASSLLAQQYAQDIKEEIKETKQKIARLNANLKELENTLPQEELTYNARAEAGYTLNSGNSDTEAFNVDARLSGKWDLHTLEVSMLWQYGEDDDIENTNRFLSELVYDYKLSERLSFDYLAGYKDDKFSGYDYQFYTGPGAKYVTIKTDFQDLTLDANLLYAKDKIFGGTDRSYGAYRVQGVYNMQLLENLKFHQTLNYRSEFSDLENYFVYSKTALSTKISDMFAAGVAYYIDYINKQVFEDKTSTDKKFTFNLIAEY